MQLLTYRQLQLDFDLATWASKMTPLPARELLESVHTFPGKFVFKAVGKTDTEFAAVVVQLIREALEMEFDPPYETRETPGGRHIAITVTPWVGSSDDVLAVYEKIRVVPGLVMLL